MSTTHILALLLSAMVTAAQAQTLIACEPTPQSGPPINSIWPSPYLSQQGGLCFDVKGWPEFSGRNCVVNGGSIAWTGMVIVSVDGESQGRDSTSFRVVKPVVNSERLEYLVEWSRGGSWQPMQRISINRLTGGAVSYFLTMHGGDSYQCHLERRKL